MSDAAVEVLLKSLRLPFAATQWQRLEEQAQREGWSPSHYLRSVLEYEQAEREGRRLTRHLKDSRLPVSKTLSSFDFSACPTLERRRVLHLAEQSDWVRQGGSVLLFGPSGVGKTHLAAGVGLALVEKGLTVRYFTATALVQLLQKARVELALEKQLLKLDRYALLVVDDIGYVRRSEAETGVLWELIAHRYERLGLVITSNRPFRDWDQIFPDTNMTVAAIDRLVHHATIIEIEAESYRRKAAESRRASGVSP